MSAKGPDLRDYCHKLTLEASLPGDGEFLSALYRSILRGDAITVGEDRWVMGDAVKPSTVSTSEAS